tara:strand:- start:401 stop:670 length:270 start_codon:yes stop_codon:yes gene_type:complete
MDVYKQIESVLEYKIPLKHRYILTEMNESKCVQIRTTNWNTHEMIQTALNHSPLLANTYSEGWCEGLKDHGLEHGDIQVIQIKLRKESK